MRAREITNKGFLKRIGKFPSIKLGRQVWYESPLERDFIHLLELDTTVTFYEEQPLKIHYTVNGRSRYYTPDFLVIRPPIKQIVEVKPEGKILSEKNQQIFRVASQACYREGCEFVVATDTKIRVQPRLDNIKVLWKYARTPLDPILYQAYCREFFSATDELALGSLFQLFAAKGLSKRVVYALLYRGRLKVNLMLPISRDSAISFAPSL